MRIYTTRHGRMGVRGGFLLVCVLGVCAVSAWFFKTMAYLLVWLALFAYEGYVMAPVQATKGANRVFRQRH